MISQTELHNPLVGEIVGGRAVIRQSDGVIFTTFDGQEARNIEDQLADFRSKKSAQGRERDA